MTQQPPPPPWGTPPPFPPGPPPPQPSGLSNKVKFWIGVPLVVPAMVVAGFLMGLADTLLDGAAPTSSADGLVVLLVGLVLLAGFTALIVVERTRWFAIGMLAGGAAALILAAGACLVLLASFTNSYG